MKASEYFAFFQSLKKAGEDDQTATGHLVGKMAGEIKEMILARRCKSPDAHKAVIYEMNDRWNAMRKMDPSFKRDGFLALLRNMAAADGLEL